jgi:PIN domain nuclease of toxin-antitoxin system
VRLLLDTVAFIWLVEGNAKLSESAQGLIADPANEVYLSAASAWEIAIKHSIGRLILRVPPEEYVPWQRSIHRVESLPVTETAALQVHKLPVLHSDPFDRIIIAQAIVDGLAVVTPDRQIGRYPVRVEW